MQKERDKNTYEPTGSDTQTQKGNYRDNHTIAQTHRHTERDKNIYKQIESETQRQIWMTSKHLPKQKGKEGGRETEREREREREREKDRDRDREKERETETERKRERQRQGHNT